MARAVSFLLLHNLDHNLCRKALELVKLASHCDFVVLCGLNGCDEIVATGKKVVGMPSLADDIYVVELLKEGGSYCAGSWKIVEGLCVGCIDAKNPFQNAERLLKEVPGECGVLLIVSAYPPKESNCSVAPTLGLPIGLEGLIDRIGVTAAGRRVIILSCNALLRNLCTDLVGGNILVMTFSGLAALLEVLPNGQGVRVAELEIVRG